MFILKNVQYIFIKRYTIDLLCINIYCDCYFKMTTINEENAFQFEKTLLNTIVKNTKETKVNENNYYYNFNYFSHES